MTEPIGEQPTGSLEQPWDNANDTLERFEALARKWLLHLIVDERNRRKDRGHHQFLHSFYAAGSDQQILRCEKPNEYGSAILDEFDNTVRLGEVARWMAEFAAALDIQALADLLCPPHASLDKNGHLEPFGNCIACIRAQRDELLNEQAARSAQPAEPEPRK